jgi:hypothetical protein
MHKKINYCENYKPKMENILGVYLGVQIVLLAIPL